MKTFFVFFNIFFYYKKVMVDEDKELATSPLNKEKLTATAPISS
jgi:hypothetical protein